MTSQVPQDTTPPRFKKNRGERIRGSQLRITEKDVYNSLTFFKRIHAWIFGGNFGFFDPNAPAGMVGNIVAVRLPSLPMRIYFKHLYKYFHKSSK